MAPPLTEDAKNKPTTQGAVIERRLIQRWISREAREIKAHVTGGPTYWEGYAAALFQLRAWLKAQPKRTATPGGIGR